MKKGFTLIELLGVIVVLGVIGLIAVPTVTKMLSDTNNDLSDSQEKLIVSAAKAYVNAHAFDDNISVSVDKLIDEGYLTSDIQLKDKYQVNINKVNNKFEFTVTKLSSSNSPRTDFRIEEHSSSGLSTQVIDDICHDDNYVYSISSGNNQVVIFDDNTEYSLSYVIKNKILTV